MEYGHEQAVADGVNVNYDVYRIRTEVSEAGAKVEAGYWLEVRDKTTRAKRDWQLDDDFEYAPEDLDRSVQTPGQIRTIARTLRDNWKRDLFPTRRAAQDARLRQGRQPCRNDRADPARRIRPREPVRAEDHLPHDRGVPEGPDPVVPQQLLPRIAVTVDMIATGTDIKPVEIVVFMRSVKSRSFFEQMKGRGVRVIKDDDLRGVNPGEHVHKDHFVIVDCVGVCERDKTDSRPMDQKKSVPLHALLQAVSLGNVRTRGAIQRGGTPFAPGSPAH